MRYTKFLKPSMQPVNQQIKTKAGFGANLLKPGELKPGEVSLVS